MSLHFLIVDDERPARDKLRRMLGLYAPPHTLSEARNGLEALQLIAMHSFDAIFLDMQMPEMDGLSVVQALPQISAAIIFVTAYDHYAVQAFDANAIDYLLKPYDESRFLNCLDKLSQRLQAPLKQQQLAPLLLNERGRIKILATAQIRYVEAADNYVLLVTHEGQHIFRQTMSGILQRLGRDYARCHRRYIVRLDQIDQLVSSEKGDYEVHLKSGEKIPCSRQYRDAILDMVLKPNF